MDLAHTMIDKLIGREGAYTNNPADRGGETIWGMTVAEARASGYTGPMIQMPRQTAADIYFQKYWVQTGFYKIAAVLPKIAEEMLDTGVNMGIAAKLPQQWLQRSLNLCNRRGQDYADIATDGLIGSDTTRAISSLIVKRGEQDAERLLLINLNGFQWERYRDIAERGGPNGSQEEFYCGWLLNRIGML